MFPLMHVPLAIFELVPVAEQAGLSLPGQKP